MPYLPDSILITAGPTREMLDPVRYLSNLSTGEMGYRLAAQAARKGYRVTLISGPTALRAPRKARVIPIVSVADLKRACEKEFPRHAILVMAAAVSDFTASVRHPRKIRRARTQHLRLKQTPDVVAGLARKKNGRRVIGFCLETERWIEQARAKMKRKNLDGIVANYCGPRTYPFGDRKVTVAVIDKRGTTRIFRRQDKTRLAKNILKWIEGLAGQRSDRTYEAGKDFRKSF